MKGIALAVLVAAVALIGGCGDDDSNGGQDTSGQGAATTTQESGAATKSDDSMKSDDDAMKSEDSMKSDDDAMKSEGDAMKSDDGVSSDDAMKSETVMTSSKSGRVVKAIGSEYGQVIADGKGEAFYLFGKEKSAKSKCFGTCAQAWPPVLTRGKPQAGSGVKAKLLGTTKRPNGKLQVTYAGHPLYYYVDDSPGTILCQNVSEFGGLWLVVKPNGNPVR